MTALADSGLLIAAVNRGDLHHGWATHHLLAARQRRTRIAVLDLVVGEAFTKLRYDRRISPRKDASVALTVVRLVDTLPDLFEVRSIDAGGYGRARDILAQYSDQGFSYVDATIFAAIDQDPRLTRVLTVDGRDFAAYRFGHAVEILIP